MSGVLGILLGKGSGSPTPSLLTPPMTTNTAPAGYTASADQEAFGTLAYQAFDGLGFAPSTIHPAVWHSDTANMTTNPHWVQLQFPGAVTITSYKVWSHPAQHPVLKYSLKGSNDGASFTTVDTQTTFTDGAELTVASPISRSYWRLEITESGDGTTGYVSVSELQLYGY